MQLLTGLQLVALEKQRATLASVSHSTQSFLFAVLDASWLYKDRAGRTARAYAVSVRQPECTIPI